MNDFKERLTKRSGKSTYLKSELVKYCNGKRVDNFCKYAHNCASVSQRKCPILQVMDKLAYYEDLEEQGNFINLPCKTGNTVYFIAKNEEGKDEVRSGIVERIRYEDRADFTPKYIYNEIYVTGFLYPIPFDAIGKIVFLTKKEAKIALNEKEASK